MHDSTVFINWFHMIIFSLIQGSFYTISRNYCSFVNSSLLCLNFSFTFLIVMRSTTIVVRIFTSYRNILEKLFTLFLTFHQTELKLIFWISFEVTNKFERTFDKIKIFHISSRLFNFDRLWATKFSLIFPPKLIINHFLFLQLIL